MTIQLGEILSGDCADDKVRDNHFRTLVALARMVEQNADTAVLITRTIAEHNQLVCKKLEDLRVELRTQSTDINKQGVTTALFDKDLHSVKKDVDSIGSKVRAHETWHETQRALKDQSAINGVDAWKRPIINWVVVGVLGLMLLGVQAWLDRASQGRLATLLDAIGKNTAALQNTLKKE